MISLSAEAIRHYHEHGYYSPVRALSAAEAAELRRHLEEYERAGGTLLVRCGIRATCSSAG